MYRTVKVGERGLAVALAVMREAAVKIGDRKIRRDGDRLAERRDRLVEIAVPGLFEAIGKMGIGLASYRFGSLVGELLATRQGLARGPRSASAVP